jgi:hypothetical protein
MDEREIEMKISQVLVAAFIPFCVWGYIDNKQQEAKRAAVEAAKSPEQKALEKRHNCAETQEMESGGGVSNQPRPRRQI